jgi:hypothetical protein
MVYLTLLAWGAWSCQRALPQVFRPLLGKASTNEPEDFLVPGMNAGFTTKEAAIDYLAERGVN